MVFGYCLVVLDDGCIGFDVWDDYVGDVLCDVGLVY